MLSLVDEDTATRRIAMHITPHSNAVASHPDAAASHLGHSFANACRFRSTRHDALLHAATLAFARRLKSDDVPPEQMVIALKHAIVTYGDGHTRPSLVDGADDDGSTRHAATYRRTFDWCLSAYFDE